MAKTTTRISRPLIRMKLGVKARMPISAPRKTSPAANGVREAMSTSARASAVRRSGEASAPSATRRRENAVEQKPRRSEQNESAQDGQNQRHRRSASGNRMGEGVGFFGDRAAEPAQVVRQGVREVSPQAEIENRAVARPQPRGKVAAKPTAQRMLQLRGLDGQQSRLLDLRLYRGEGLGQGLAVGGGLRVFGRLSGDGRRPKLREAGLKVLRTRRQGAQRGRKPCLDRVDIGNARLEIGVGERPRSQTAIGQLEGDVGVIDDRRRREISWRKRVGALARNHGDRGRYGLPRYARLGFADTPERHTRRQGQDDRPSLPRRLEQITASPTPGWRGPPLAPRGPRSQRSARPDYLR